MGIIWWLIVGLIAGWLTGKVMGGSGKGALMDIIVGLVGAITVVSAVLPGIRDRTELINQLVPDVFPAAATTGAAALGLVLILPFACCE